MLSSKHSKKNIPILCLAFAFLAIACTEQIIVSPGLSTAPSFEVNTISINPSRLSDGQQPALVTLPSQNKFRVVKLSGTINKNLTLQEGVGYFLDGLVYIGNETNQGPTLTIQPGATIYGSGAKSSLIVTRGSKVIARGTKEKPIIFTSLKELERKEITKQDSSDARGEWGGIFINGMAPINNCNNGNSNGGTASCENERTKETGKYGGAYKEDYSGILEYIRVEHAGQSLQQNNGSTGITFQGVGEKTRISNIHVHNSNGNGVDFNGGTVGATNLVITGASGNSINWTEGWQGNLQNVVVLQSAKQSKKMVNGNNYAMQDPHRIPRSKPKLANFTLIGNETDSAIVLKEGTGGEFYNGIVVKALEGIVFNDEETYKLLSKPPHNIDNGRILFDSIILNNRSITKSITTGDITAEAIKRHLSDRILEKVDIDETNFIPGPAIGDVLQRNKKGELLFLGSDNRVYSATDIRPPQNKLSGSPLTTRVALGRLPISDLSNVSGLANKHYIGAFSPTETLTENWAAGWTKPDTLFRNITPPENSCPEGTSTGGRLGHGKLACRIVGTIEKDLTLKAINNIYYRLYGKVFVGRDSGPRKEAGQNSNFVTLTIEPGVTVFGDSANDGLIINRGSKIIAEGTKEKPIVFTSGKAVRGNALYDTDSGEWMGLTINGRAGINKCKVGGGISGKHGGTHLCQGEGEAETGKYGGEVDLDNSGSLKYVRVEFAGKHYSEEAQTNGISFQGVGSGTKVEYVQVHNNGDDGVEFFGGTVNAKYLVITGAGDDAVDWTDGWRGNIQYLIIEQKDENDHAFEGDNYNESEPNISPRSAPSISNFTIIGNPNNPGIKLREGTAGKFVNGIISGNKFGIDIDDPSKFKGGSYQQMLEENLVLSSILIDSNTPVVDDSRLSDSNKRENFTAKEIRTKIKNLKLGSLTLTGDNTFYENRKKIGYIPSSVEKSIPIFNTKLLNQSDENLFETVDFIGAVKDKNDNWYTGWTVNYRGVTSER